MSKFSRKVADDPADEIWTSKLDLDYAYGQLILSKEARNLCIFAVTGGDFTGYYRFLKGFYCLADIPTILQEKIDQTLENKHPAWLDDIIIVTKGSKEQHKIELNETTNDPTLLKTLVCLERQQHDQIPDEYLPHKKRLSSRFGLVFIEDKNIVPKNLRTTIISLLHKGPPSTK